jgi:hypothetical protein
MLTCYGTIASIANLPTNSGPDEILRVGRLSPFERLRDTSDAVPKTKDAFAALEAEYLWFLEVTNVSEQDLMHRFHDKSFREDAFARAEVFGDSMYAIVRTIAEDSGYLRYLVI